MGMFRFKDGKIVEDWVGRDDLGVLIQLEKVTVEPRPE
jgi:hypothetical protein